MVNRMDIGRLQQQSETRWIIPRTGRMRTPAILYASPELIHAMDTKVLEQLTNIATLPGIETAAFAMPDAHWGYGFPIGGVAAFDAETGDVVKRLKMRNILIRSTSARSIAEEAPGAYKDVSDVVEVTENSRLARKVAKLAPLICIKG